MVIRLGGIFGIIGGGFIAFAGIIILLTTVFARWVTEPPTLGLGSGFLTTGVLAILCSVRALKTSKWKWAIPGFLVFIMVVLYFVIVIIYL